MFKKGKLSIRAVEVVSYLLILLPVALGFFYVYSFGVNVIAGDSWAMVELFRKLHSGRLGLWDLWAQHAEHRVFFPQLASLSLGVLTDFNSVAEMYLTLVCFLVTLVALLLAFRSSVERNLFFFLPVPFLVFSLRQYENMLTGFQIAFAFVQVFSVLALFFLHVSGREGGAKPKRLAFPAALGSGTVAAFSAAQGLFVWPIGLLQLLISPVERPTKKWLMGAWGLFGVGAWTLYFIGYEKPDQMPPLGYVFGDPTAGISYFLTLLGSPLFWQPNSALVGGLLLACLALVGLLLVYKDGRWGEYSFWVALLLFSFLILVSITLGRAGFGTLQATQSKYASFSVLAVIGLYAILLKRTLYVRSYPTIASLGLLFVLVVSSIPVSYAEGAEAGRRTKMEREAMAFTLSTYKTQSDEILQEVHGRPNVGDRAHILENLGYSVFSEPRPRVLPPEPSALSPIPSPTLSGVDTITDTGAYIKVSGWAVDAEAEDVAGGVYVIVDGKPFPAFHGTDRNDVAARFGVPSYRYSGFERAIPVSEIGPGAHELSVMVLTNDRERYYGLGKVVTFEIR